MGILNLPLAIEYHQAREELHDTRALREQRGAVIETLPRQRLAAREEKKKEAATAKTRENERYTQPPHRPRSEGIPAAVSTHMRSEGAKQDAHESSDCENDAETSCHADRLESPVRDTKTDEVTM